MHKIRERRRSARAADGHVVIATGDLFEQIKVKMARCKKTSSMALIKMRTLRLFTNHKGKSKECLGRSKKDVE